MGHVLLARSIREGAITIMTTINTITNMTTINTITITIASTILPLSLSPSPPPSTSLRKVPAGESATLTFLSTFLDTVLVCSYSRF